MPDSQNAPKTAGPGKAKPLSALHDYVVRCDLRGGFRGDAMFRLAVNACPSEQVAREQAQKVLDAQRPVFPWLITAIEDLGPTTHKEYS
jgi:hypothetical protein